MCSLQDEDELRGKKGKGGKGKGKGVSLEAIDRLLITCFAIEGINVTVSCPSIWHVVHYTLMQAAFLQRFPFFPHILRHEVDPVFSLSWNWLRQINRAIAFISGFVVVVFVGNGKNIPACYSSKRWSFGQLIALLLLMHEKVIFVVCLIFVCCFVFQWKNNNNNITQL